MCTECVINQWMVKTTIDVYLVKGDKQGYFQIAFFKHIINVSSRKDHV